MQQHAAASQPSVGGGGARQVATTCTKDSIGAWQVLLEHAAGMSDLAGQRGRVYYTRAGRTASPATLAPSLANAYM